MFPALCLLDYHGTDLPIPGFGEFILFLSAEPLELGQNRRGVSLYHYLQVPPNIRFQSIIWLDVSLSLSSILTVYFMSLCHPQTSVG